MKMNKTKIIVPTLALAMGAALAGSVSGTVAWFQYATRAQAAYIGSTAHCSELLQMKIGDGEWGNEFDSSDIDTAINGAYGTNIIPISAGGIAANGALTNGFYKNPIYQIQDSSKWGAAEEANYVTFDLSFRLLDVNQTANTPLTGHNLYLADISIVSLNAAGTAEEQNDLYKAVRVHISTANYKGLFAADKDNAGEIQTLTHGNLDLNSDGAYDLTEGYEWTSNRTAIDYGSGTQSANNAADDDTFVDDSDPYDLDNVSAANTIGEISGTLTVTVTIWLEGWQKLDAGVEDNIETSDTAIWDATAYVGKKFGVGLRFVTEAHGDNE